MRFACLTSASSKWVENQAAAVAHYFVQLQLRAVHQTFRVTPAMEEARSESRLAR